MGSKFNVTEVVAYLCKTHSVSLSTVNQILGEGDTHKFSTADRRMGDHITNLLFDNTFYMKMSVDEIDDFEEEEEEETIDFGESSGTECRMRDVENVNETNEGDSESEEEMDIDDVSEVFSESEQLCERDVGRIESVEEEKWLEAFGFWTRQSVLPSEVSVTEEMLDKTDKRKMSTVLSKYRFVGGKSSDPVKYLREWAKRQITGKVCTFRRINELVFERFKKRRAVHGAVSDLMVRKWAMEVKNDLDSAFPFRASVGWLLNFKKKYNLVSRAITHKVSKDFDRSEAVLREKSEEFVREVRRVIEENNLSLQQVVNADQSSFKKELHSFHTLDSKGVKQVFVSIGSKNATTHSMMIMPFVDADGGLCRRLYLLCQESSGAFPQVRAPAIPSNLRAFAGRTAMMSKRDLFDFLDGMVKELVSKGLTKALILLDSWSSNSDDDLWRSVCEKHTSIQLIKMLIPAGCTGLIQPLDVFFFRPYKNFVKHIVHSLVLENKVFQRDNMLGLHAFVHFQFGAPRFRDLIRYAFHRCGYVDNRPASFETPTEYCFDIYRFDLCSTSGCSSKADIRCAHCTLCYCFEHSVLSNPHINCLDN